MKKAVSVEFKLNRAIELCEHNEHYFELSRSLFAALYTIITRVAV